MQSKPLAAGLNGEDNMTASLELTGAFMETVWERKTLSCFEKMYTS